MSTTTELENRYARLFNDGKLVSLHIAKWSMSSRLDKEDLGVKQDLPANLFKLGNKMLIKNDVLAKFMGVEQKARTFLKNNSHQFPIAQAHFVPNKRIVYVVTQLNRFKDEYEALVQDFLTNYEQYKMAMLEAYPEYKNTLAPCYPAVDELRHKFLFEISMFEISIPKSLKEIDLVELRANDEAVEELKKKFEAEMEAQYQKGVSRIDEFLEQTVYSLRGEIINVFETVAQKIKNREVITKTNLTSLKSIIDNFKSMDFLNDKVISDKLTEVEALVSSGKDFKEDNQAIRRLDNAINSALESAKDISDVSSVTGQYFRKISL